MVENSEKETSDTNEGKGDSGVKKREIVLPGDLLDEGYLYPGSGTYREGGKIYSANVGLMSVRSKYVNVISLAGKYIPKEGDVVIGKITDMSNTSWIVDINSPYNAPLKMNDVPWKLEFGETSRYLVPGDIIFIKVISVDEIKRVQVTMKGPGLRKLNGGNIIDISALKVPRMIGKGGSMISLLKKYTRCNIFVGQNGRIWLDGEPDDIKMATKVIGIIEKNAHVSGLTNLIETYLKEVTGIE
jgi:exosome complex component RRP4